MYLAERGLLAGLDEWIATLFEPDHLEATIIGLASAEMDPTVEQAQEALNAEVQECERDLQRFKRLLTASDEPPESLLEWIRETEMRRAQAQRGLVRQQARQTPNVAQLEAFLADVPRVQQRLRKASQAGKQSLYAALDARLRFEVGERKVHITGSLAGSLAGLCGTRTCPRGDLNPLPA